jgi:hypothetical protein
VSLRDHTGSKDTEFEREWPRLLRSVRRLQQGSNLKGEVRMTSIRLGDIVLSTQKTGQGEQVALLAQNALTDGAPVVIATLD